MNALPGAKHIKLAYLVVGIFDIKYMSQEGIWMDKECLWLGRREHGISRDPTPVDLIPNCQSVPFLYHSVSA